MEVHRLLSNASSVGQRAKENLVSVTCDHRSVASPNVTCNLTVDNVTSTDAGFYRASLGNGFGFLHFAFEIQVNGKPCTRATEHNVCTDIGTKRSDVKYIIGGSCHKYHFCLDERFVATNTCLSRQNTSFVVTKVCFFRDKTSDKLLA